jgi:hypothetical protein
MNNLKLQSAASSANPPTSKIPSALSHNHQHSSNAVASVQTHVYARSTSRPKESNLHMSKLQAMLGKSTGVLNAIPVMPGSTRNSQTQPSEGNYPN